MKFSSSEIELLVFRIMHRLKIKKLLQLKAAESKVREKIASIFNQNQAAEEALEEEVRQLLKEHEAAFASGQMDYHKMFLMVKKKLAKEKGFIL